MKKQKKNSLKAYNKKPDIDEVVKLVESYTKPFNDMIKERLEYYRNDNILWARNLFNKTEQLFEEFFGEPLRSIFKNSAHIFYTKILRRFVIAQARNQNIILFFRNF